MLILGDVHRQNPANPLLQLANRVLFLLIVKGGVLIDAEHRILILGDLLFLRRRVAQFPLPNALGHLSFPLSLRFHFLSTDVHALLGA